MTTDSASTAAAEVRPSNRRGNDLARLHSKEISFEGRRADEDTPPRLPGSRRLDLRWKLTFIFRLLLECRQGTGVADTGSLNVGVS
jgi:hypothetical protein